MPELKHGRIETRRGWSLPAPEWLTGFDQWRDLKSLTLIESTREIKDQSTVETRYFISSLEPDALRALAVACAHWGVGNS